MTLKMIKNSGRLPFIKAAVIALLAGALGLTGCLFEPREAQTPGGGSNWVSPDEPSKVISNMITGLEGLAIGNYENSIGDEFEFVPLPSDLSNFPSGELDNWNREVELEASRNLLDQASKIEALFDPFTQVSGTGDLAKYETIYKLTVTFVTAPGNPEIFQGKAYFYFKRGSKGYVLTKWEDIEVVEGQTWGYLRGTLRTL